jgi:hypothetical protein
MGKSDGGSGSGEIRYAPYLEAAHGKLLDHEGADEPTISFIDTFNATMCKHEGFTDAVNDKLISSPYRGYEQIDIDDGFFGRTRDDPTVNYHPVNYPGLWDMFGKFMAGVDVHDLWGLTYSDVVQGPEIENAVSAQSALVQDDIDTVVLPKFLGGMRDINSVQSTAFVIGKSIIQTAHVKAINKFSSDLRLRAIDISNAQWIRHLDWNQSVIGVYSEMFKLYYASRMDMDRVNLEYQAKDVMWDINLFENARAFLGAMGGGAATAGQNEPSTAQKAVGGALGGAAAGWQVSGGNPIGAVIGGVLGLAGSFL